VSDEVDIDVWGCLIATSNNMLFSIADLRLCAIVRHPHLSVTCTFSHFANFWLFFRWFVGAGAFGVESSWADERPSVLVGLLTRPTATIMRINHKDLVRSTLDLTALVLGVPNLQISSISHQAEETRMALMGDPELSIATAVAQGVVCIAAS